MGKRRVDVHGFQSRGPPFGFRLCAEGSHIVEPVAELDEDDADVLGHGKKHLADVLHVRLFLVLYVDVVDLCQSIDKHGDLGTEPCGDRRQVRFVRAVLYRIVQKRGTDGIGIQPERGDDFRNGNGMGNVRVSTDAELPLMERRRVQKCPIDLLQIVVLAARFQNV